MMGSRAILIQLYDRPRDEASLDEVEADRDLKNTTFWSDQ
jgi:hypothetical protein